MNFEEVVNYRRSIRNYRQEPMDTEAVKQCIEMATLAPNSSNMQLWEFIHVTNKETLSKIADACFGQMAAKTAQEMVVIVGRRDLFKQRAKKVLQLEIENIKKNSPEDRQAGRIKRAEKYYGQTMPFLYSYFFGVIGFIRIIIAKIIGLFRLMYQEVSESKMRGVVHKSCALAAQTFMLGMASKELDTCPMEGYDSRKIKKILKIPYGADVNMIISCGVREKSGVFGDRMRVPFEDVYKRV